MITFSVIIPALNEEESIALSIASVWASDPTIEVIVADGGSTDGTVTIAQQAGAQVCCARGGRGPQCNAGAALASGAVLLFLHADTMLPRDAFAILQDTFADDAVQIGKFRLAFDTRDWLLDFAARCMWLDSAFTSYGDQCIVVRKTFFQELGGFPDWPLFEDVRLFETARWRTHVYVIPAEVTTSARRFMQNGVSRQLLQDVWYMVRYLTGMPPQRLATTYERDGADIRGPDAGESPAPHAD